MGCSLRLVSLSAARRVRKAFSAMLSVGSDVEPHLRDVVSETLANPGNLVRAQLAYGVAVGGGVAPARALRLAVAVEYFHAASLLFDDMPAMEDLSPQGRERATRLVAECLGLAGILDGQARDVHFQRRAAREPDILRVGAAKTVPLVRLALVLPAILAGARARTIARLERLAAHWGLAYQVLDDFKDVLLSEAEAGKTTSRDHRLGRPNLPQQAGVARALERLAQILSAARAEVWILGRRERNSSLERLQEALEAAHADVVRRLATAAAA
jgi:geranylgeranyl diphosphate synthase, type II